MGDLTINNFSDLKLGIKSIRISIKNGLNGLIPDIDIIISIGARNTTTRCVTCYFV